MRPAKLCYYIGLFLSLLVGIGHFFVPSVFQWTSYIPAEYENLIVGIDWTNYFFSLCLTGLSLILLFWGNKVFARNKEALVIYGFMVFVWMNRVAIAFIEPWPLEPIAWAAYTQFLVTILIFALLLTALGFTVLPKAEPTSPLSGPPTSD